MCRSLQRFSWFRPLAAISGKGPRAFAVSRLDTMSTVLTRRRANSWNVYKTSFGLEGGSPGLVGMGDDSCSSSWGSIPGTVYWMDMTFLHIDLLLKLYCLFEKTENKRKRGLGWTIFLKKSHLVFGEVSSCGTAYWQTRCFDTSGQSYQGSTIVNYDSRVYYGVFSSQVRL